MTGLVESVDRKPHDMTSHDSDQHLVSPADKAAAHVDTVSPSATAAEPLIALLVEDNLADAELIAIRLAPNPELPNSGHVRLVHVTSAASAIAALRHSAVKVIILDLSLPDARGLE